MSQHYLRKYGVQTTLHFVLYEVDGVDLRVDAADGGTDCTLMKDEGADTTCDNDFADEGNGYSLVLTATEMEFAEGQVYIIDSAAKVYLDEVLKIETYGNASAMHAQDFDTTVPTVAEIQAEMEQDGASLLDTIRDVVNNLPNSGSLSDLATILSRLGTPANIDTGGATIADNLKKLADDNGGLTFDATNDSLNIIRDQIDAVPTVGEILAGVIEGTTTIQQALRLFLSVLTGKSSGGGTSTLVFRDIGDTKNRISATVDANGNRTAVGTRDGS